jgi:DNA-binding NarL/FixJ family response regulator
MKASARIALVDDNRAWRETLAEYLQDKGFEVFTAENARSGLELLESKDIRTAVIDFHMGEMNGLELLLALRRRYVPVAAFLMSSDEDPTLPSRASAAGARAFLPKSVAPTAFLRMLLQLLQDEQPYFPLVIRGIIDSVETQFAWGLRN